MKKESRIALTAFVIIALAAVAFGYCQGTILFHSRTASDCGYDAEAELMAAKAAISDRYAPGVNADDIRIVVGDSWNVYSIRYEYVAGDGGVKPLAASDVDIKRHIAAAVIYSGKEEPASSPPTGHNYDASPYETGSMAAIVAIVLASALIVLTAMLKGIATHKPLSVFAAMLLLIVALAATSWADDGKALQRRLSVAYLDGAKEVIVDHYNTALKKEDIAVFVKDGTGYYDIKLRPEASRKYREYGASVYCALSADAIERHAVEDDEFLVLMRESAGHEASARGYDTIYMFGWIVAAAVVALLGAYAADGGESSST